MTFLVGLRGFACTHGEVAHLTADNVTATLIVEPEGSMPAALVAGELGLGGVLVTLSAGGTAALCPPGRAHAALFRSASLITEPQDNVDAWLLVAALDRVGENDDRAPIEHAARRLGSSLLRAAHRAAIPCADRKGGGPGYQAQIAETRHRIASAVQRALTLRTLADDTGWSPWYLSRRFSAEVGLPVHRYLMRARLRAAMAQIIGTRDGLAQIATAVGFSSHSHFTSAFRSEFGITPTSLRHLVEPQSRDALLKALRSGDVKQAAASDRVAMSPS